MGVFSTNYRHERNVFFGNGSFFWQNMRIRAVIFSWKIRKKGHLIVFFGPSCIVEFWQKWSFLTKFGMKAGGFSWKIWKIWYWRYVFLLERTFFWQNMGMITVCCSENGRFFWQNLGMRASIFSWKIGNKSILSTFVKNRKRMAS